MATRGRTGGFKLTDEHRTKIANSQILNRLISYVEGKVQLEASQVTAGVALLKKVLPDLSSVDNKHSGADGGAITFQTVYEPAKPAT